MLIEKLPKCGNAAIYKVIHNQLLTEQGPTIFMVYLRHRLSPRCPILLLILYARFGAPVAHAPRPPCSYVAQNSIMRNIFCIIEKK